MRVCVYVFVWMNSPPSIWACFHNALCSAGPAVYHRERSMRLSWQNAISGNDITNPSLLIQHNANWLERQFYLLHPITSEMSFKHPTVLSKYWCYICHNMQRRIMPTAVEKRQRRDYPGNHSSNIYVSEKTISLVTRPVNLQALHFECVFNRIKHDKHGQVSDIWSENDRRG